MRFALWPTCLLSIAFFATACGGSEDPAAFSSSPIDIKPLSMTPSCFTEPPPPPTAASDAEEQMLRAVRAMREFDISFAFQEARILSSPIVEQPTSNRWRKNFENGHVEGAVLARGEDWAVVKMVIVNEAEVGPRSLDAEIDITPRRTVFDFGGRTLDVRENLFVLGDYARGCDPATGVSFERGPAVRGGYYLEGRCWRPGETIPPDDGSAASAEFRASRNLQCLQLVEKLLRE